MKNLKYTLFISFFVIHGFTHTMQQKKTEKYTIPIKWDNKLFYTSQNVLNNSDILQISYNFSNKKYVNLNDTFQDYEKLTTEFLNTIFSILEDPSKIQKLLEKAPKEDLLNLLIITIHTLSSTNTVYQPLAKLLASKITEKDFFEFLDSLNNPKKESFLKYIGTLRIPNLKKVIAHELINAWYIDFMTLLSDKDIQPIKNSKLNKQFGYLNLVEVHDSHTTIQTYESSKYFVTYGNNTITLWDSEDKSPIEHYYSMDSEPFEKVDISQDNKQLIVLEKKTSMKSNKGDLLPCQRILTWNINKKQKIKDQIPLNQLSDICIYEKTITNKELLKKAIDNDHQNFIKKKTNDTNIKNNTIGATKFKDNYFFVQLTTKNGYRIILLKLDSNKNQLVRLNKFQYDTLYKSTIKTVPSTNKVLVLESSNLFSILDFEPPSYLKQLSFEQTAILIGLCLYHLINKKIYPITKQLPKKYHFSKKFRDKFKANIIPEQLYSERPKELKKEVKEKVLEKIKLKQEEGKLLEIKKKQREKEAREAYISGIRKHLEKTQKRQEKEKQEKQISLLTRIIYFPYRYIWLPVRNFFTGLASYFWGN